MNKLILTIVIICFTINAFAQDEKPITKGNIIISGGVSAYFDKTSTESETSTNERQSFMSQMTPGVSYFIVDNFAVGLSAPLHFSKGETSHSYSYGLGPSASYYTNFGVVFKIESTFSIIHNINPDLVNIPKDRITKDFRFSPSIGYAIFLNPKVSLEPAVSYGIMNKSTNTLSSDYISKSKRLNFEVTLNVFL